jgi:hypothetical protein
MGEGKRRFARASALVAAIGLSACSLLVSTNGLDNSPGGPDGSPGTTGGPPSGSEAGAGDGTSSSDPDGSSGPVSKYRALIMAEAPIAYWRMGIASGSVVPDETSRHNDLILQGTGIERGAAGAIAGDSDTSLRITDRSSYGVATDARPFDFPNGAAFTIEFWAKFDLLDGGDLGLGLLSAQTGGVGYGTFVHGSGADGTWSGFEMQFGQDASPASQNVQGPPYATTTFSYVVITFDGTTLSYYMEGNLKSQQPVTQKLLPRTSDFRVPDFYSGSIDEVAIYDHALTLTQIVHHHDVGTTP